MGRGGEIVVWRVQTSSLESEKDAKRFPPNLRGSCHGGEMCGREETEPIPDMQSLISLELSER